MRNYVWEPCCDTMRGALGQDLMRVIPEFDGNNPTGGKFTLHLHLGKFGDSLRVLHIHFCPGCGEELRGKRKEEVA